MLNIKKSFIPLTAALLLAACGPKEIPLVYEQENTGAGYVAPRMAPEGLSEPCAKLPDALAWASGKGRVGKFGEWEKRRSEILNMLQYYETGEKPAVEREAVSASMDGDTLKVDVTVNGETLHLQGLIRYPETGSAPYPLMIGASMISLPPVLLDGVATMFFRESQVNGYTQMRWPGMEPKQRGEHEFDRLYPEFEANGAYSEWAWGFSRLIDALQILGPEKTRIDTRHIGVTGCSYAGKMALFCGALDERVALTIAQEPGGGGAAAWRVSRTFEGVEDHMHTDYHWFKESFREVFADEKIENLPYDRHELVSLVFPRAVLLLGNTDYKWLADTSMYVSANAAAKVWEEFGVGDRFGYSIVGGHPHCMLPETQYPEVEAFIGKFLKGDADADTRVRRAPGMENVDVESWLP